MAEGIFEKIYGHLNTADEMGKASGGMMQRAEMALIEAIQTLQVAKGNLYSIIGQEDTGALTHYAVTLQSAMDMCQASIGQIRVAYGNIPLGKEYGDQFRAQLATWQG
jgi:3-dehydroquinate dehydratase